jgi:hypothetical protein
LQLLVTPWPYKRRPNATATGGRTLENILGPFCMRSRSTNALFIASAPEAWAQEHPNNQTRQE